MHAYITSIGTHNPPNKFSQEQISEFMIRSLDLKPEDARRLKSLYRATGIKNRHSVLPDYGSLPENFSFYPRNESLNPLPTTANRMIKYQHCALLEANGAIEDCINKHPNFNKRDITHLITVSCTGMTAPGLDIQIVKKFGLSGSVKRTCINYMGCYAAFNALKVGNSIITSDPTSKVLIVSVELCSLHFQHRNNDNDIVSGAIFGDGAAAVLMESNPIDHSSLSIENELCDLIHDDGKNMSWKIGDFGFEMKLTSEVPSLINGQIQKLALKILRQKELQLSDVDYFAIHPGGRKILEYVEATLQIEQIKNLASWDVLREFGNMSSPTILFVLKKVMDELQSQNADSNILSFAFGPGLTLESILFKSAKA